VKQLVERYLRHLTIERGLSKNSLAAYRRDLERYTGFLAERGIDDPASISVGDTQAFMSWLRDPDELDMSASSAARIASSVRGFHRFLDDEGVVDGDVASELKAPKQARRLPKALTIDEVQALLEVLYASGARISEAVGLAVDDVIDRDMVRVRGKGDKQRVVPLGSYAQAALGAYLVRARPIFAAKGKGSPALFLGVRGGALSRNSAWNILQRVAERAELSTHVSPHTLRHSFATHLMQGGADVRVVQELLGHSSVSTTQIYTKVTADALREMYALAHPRAR
jgi:integrase/recombinase XerD